MTGVPVLLVEMLDSAPATREEGRVTGELRLLRIMEVGQQAEPEIRVLVAEIPDLERVQQVLDVAFAAEKARHHDERRVFLRQALRVVHARQGLRSGQQGRQPVRE